MAKVFQFMTTDEGHPRHDESICNGDWHAICEAAGDSRSVCGVQMDGDDGYAPGPTKEGRVTCHTCRAFIEEIQGIKKWK